MKQDEHVIVSGVFRVEDVREYHAAHLWKLKWLSFTAIFLLSTLTIFSVIHFTYLDLFFNTLWSMQLGIAVGVSLIPASLTLITSKIALNHRSASEYKSDPTLRSAITYTFGEEAIKQEKGESTSYFGWNDILSVQEHRGMYLLYLSKYKAIVLPKRFFETEAQQDSFQDVVASHVDASKLNWN
ncbi:YcxB family protein [Halobacillus salinus]|uniref:YcxB family protein n=1 Tax=Halobacillus salinus TaxID=192814 RepID=UPI0009A80325|nr:YcxB family protein [Halobacillus salinus]